MNLYENIVNGTEVSINDLGVYKAQVEVNGIPKSGNGGYSTFFPKEMSPQDVIDSINEAYNNKVFVVGSKNSYIGTSNNGLEIEKLQQLRDTLLPKLMSGEIDVSKINCDFILWLYLYLICCDKFK